MLYNLFSKRQKRLRGQLPDVYQYVELPTPFRVQAVHLLLDIFGDPAAYNSPTRSVIEQVRNGLCREFGLFSLTKQHAREPAEDLVNFLLETTDIERALDVIEFSFRSVFDNYRYEQHSRVPLGNAVDELNARFREHGIGYQLESLEIVRVDSQVLHEEAVKPALFLLSRKEFAGANDEFLKAHGHYRHGRNGEAINECLKAFESTLKTICRSRGWTYTEKDTAKGLLDIVFSKGLVPNYMHSEFSSLRALLEAGVPTTRNRTSGHGAGPEPKTVAPHLAALMLHTTAAAIVFLVTCNDAR